jgi:ribonuclease-3
VRQFWAEALSDLDGPSKDPKTRLQEWAMARALPFPEYVVTGQDGPAHQPRFTVEVRVKGVEPQTGQAGSKREAEKLAADRMLEHLKDHP